MAGCKLLVVLRGVLDPALTPRIRADGLALEPGRSQRLVLNPWDAVALAAAVGLREQGRASDLLAVAVGGPELTELLVAAQAVGADRALRVAASRELGQLALARELAAVASREASELVLLGGQSADDESNELGPMLAALLGWGQVVDAHEITLQDGTTTVRQSAGGADGEFELPLPAVVAAALDLAEPRHVHVGDLRRARLQPPAVQPGLGDESETVHTRALRTAPGRSGERVMSVEALAQRLSTMLADGAPQAGEDGVAS